MLFNSYEFIFVFLPLTWICWHWVAGRAGAGAGRRCLLAASLVFYGFGGPWLLGVLGGSLGFNFLTGRLLGREMLSARWRRLLLGMGVAGNLGLLGWFKYAGFFAANAGWLLGTEWTLAPIVLPLGISFYTFQQIGYLVDAYRGLTREYRFVDYSLFVTFFPQLIAGPIVHHADLLPQFKATNQPAGTAAGFAEGLTLFTLGLAKKVLIADRLAGPAGKVFGAVGLGADVTCGDAWLGLLAYTFQIYFDFSGYSDMAVGLGRMFGVRLPFNFNSPYAAVSLADFWRRWHITLSNFIRDYLYIPLGGNRRGRPRTLCNLMVVMTLAGLWHGANWTFVVWGAAHGLVLAAGQWVRAAPEPDAATRWRQGFGWLTTFTFVTLAWVLFRSDGLASAGRYYAELMELGSGTGATSLVKPRYWILVVLLGFAVRCLPNSRQLVPPGGGEGAEPAWWGAFRWRPCPAWAWGLGLLLTACLLSLSEVSEFLYWQF